MTTPGSSVTPGESVALGESVHTGQKAQKEKTDQCLDQSELPVLNSPDRSVQLEHNVHEQSGNMPNLQAEHWSEHSEVFQDFTNSAVRVSGQMSLPSKLICDILDIGLRASVTPVTVQTMSIQSPNLDRLGLMLLSTGQTEPDITLMSLVLHGEIVTHIVKLFPSDTLTQVNTLQLQ